MAEIVPVVSEALEAQVRNLLPSQRGFGQDLQASNVIVPIIDLTATAEGTTTPEYLQTAWDFNTSFHFQGAAGTTTLTSTTGFWRVDLNTIVDTAQNEQTNIALTDGLSTKVIWEIRTGLGSGGDLTADAGFVVFIKAGTSLTITATSGAHGTSVWYRQVADVNGNLVYPSGFTPQ